MEWLKIHNAFLYIYEEPVIHLNHELFQMPEQLLLKASELHGNVENIPAIHQKKRQKIFSGFPGWECLTGHGW